MPIIRNTAGLILADDFNRADSGTVGGDWVERAGNWEIASNRLKNTANNFNHYIENQAGGLSLTSFVQATTAVSGDAAQANILPFFDNNAGSHHLYGFGVNPSVNGLILLKRVAGSTTQLASTAATVNTGTDYVVQGYTTTSIQEGWASAGGGVTVSAADTAHNARTGVAGCRHETGANITCEWDDYIWCSDKNIVVTGLATGQKAKIRNGSGTVLATATESGGTATIDASRFGGCTENVPIAGFADLVVTDSSDTIIETYNATGVFPGDEYSYSAGTTVTPGAAALTITGLAPTVTVNAVVTTAPGAASLTITGLAPAVVATTDPVCEFGFPPGMPADYRARIDYAVTDSNVAPPAEDSPVWLTAGALLAEGTLATPPLPAGAYVWIRARGEAAARRPSVWTVPIVVQVPSVATLSAATIFLSGAVPNVGWTAGTFTLGVRIRYSLGSPGHVPSWTLEGDVPAADGNYTFPATNVAEGQEIRVELTPYTGFGGGSVSGEAGAPTVLQVARVTEDTPAITFVSAARTLAGDCALVPMTHRVAWNVDGDFTGFEVTIEVSEDGGAFVELANSLGASGTYDHEIADVQHDADAAAVAYIYRVALVRTSGGSVLASDNTPTLTSRPVACGS